MAENGRWTPPFPFECKTLNILSCLLYAQRTVETYKACVIIRGKLLYVIG